MRKVVFMIDGWFMYKRVKFFNAFDYNGPNIRKYCCSHLLSTDVLYRIFYYDTEPLKKKGTNPISKNFIDFSQTSIAKEQEKLLNSIKETPHFALRLGNTHWKGNQWILYPNKFDALIKKTITVDDLTENDVRPLIEQKAVDMKIGLDIALIAMKKLANTLIIITGDADIVPALKLARREGMEVGLDPLYSNIQPLLKEHVDFIASKIKQPFLPQT